MSKPKPSPLIQFYPDRETPVFTGNTAITVITQKTLRDPLLPMSQYYWGEGFFVGDLLILRFGESRCIQEKLGKD